MWYGSQGHIEPSIICIFDITKSQGLPPTTIHEVTKKATLLILLKFYSSQLSFIATNHS